MGWVVNATPRPVYPRERPRTYCTGSWVGLRAGLDGCGRSRPHRDSTPKTFENKDCVTMYNLLYHQRKYFWMSISFNINEHNFFWNDDDRNSPMLVILFRCFSFSGTEFITSISRLVAVCPSLFNCSFLVWWQKYKIVPETHHVI
jgi:hypothetical protein